MTDQEINQAIHDHLGLPRTVTRWGFELSVPGQRTEQCRPYRTREEAETAAKWMEEQSWGGAAGSGKAGPVEPYEQVRPVKDYCNGRDAMAEAITALGEDIVYNLIPNQGTPDEDGGYSTNEVFHALTLPCRDLAVAFCKTIHPDKITP